MDPSTSNSFTPLATIHLTGPHVLHPEACNPTMDLVALLGLSGTQAGPSKAQGRDAVGSVSKVALWRMSGSRVWEADLEGQVGGMAWTPDGLHLSVLVVKSTGSAILSHLSVHTGEVVKVVPVQLEENTGAVSSSRNGQWWKMSWSRTDQTWPTPENGSAGKIIDSLPRVTPVDPPQAANAHPFMLPNAAKAKKTATTASHVRLDSFPSLLPTSVPSSPDILHLSPPDGTCSMRLLTGTLPLGSRTRCNKSTLRLAQTCNRLELLLNTVLRGLEAIDHAFKEGEKQTMIWREELETCADQQGMSHADVHADLFRLLVAGRAGIAVTEWLGNRLTGRTIAKWELALETSHKTIRKILAESIGPALERVVLLLEELRGWSLVPDCSILGLNEKDIRQTLDVTLGFAKLTERMRQQAEHELYASAEWFKWLKYEIGRAAAQDVSSDTFLPSLCDTKLVWHYLKHGFVHSPLLVHLPQQFRTRPTDDRLPVTYNPNPVPATRRADEVMAETLRFLERTPATGKEESSPTLNEVSIDSSMMMSSPRAASPVIPSSPEIPSSPDTVDQKTALVEETPEPPRALEQEPWVWTNTLIANLQDLVRFKDILGTAQDLWVSADSERVVRRVVSDVTYTAVVHYNAQLLTILRSSQSADVISFRPAGSEAVLSVAFFDDAELALLLQSQDGERYLATVSYTEIAEWRQVQPPTSLAELIDAARNQLDHPPAFARSRYLKTVSHSEEDEHVSIALNGRAGRRVGCVIMGDGKEVEVLDMDQDEDAEDDDEEEDGEADMSGVIEE